MSTASKLVSDKSKTPIDTSVVLRILDAKIAATKDPKRKRNLEIVREHMYYETKIDLPGIMKTLAPNAKYKFWADGQDDGPKGNDAILEWYKGFARVKALVLVYKLDHIVADDDCVVTEGQMSAVVDATYALQFFGKKCDPSDMFMHSFRQIIFWPFDASGELVGEEIYVTGQTHPDAWRKLEPHEIPEQWKTMVKVSQES
jgi:hypothetical protein